MPFLPAGPPEGPPPDLLPIELLLRGQIDLLVFHDRNVTQQDVTTLIEVPLFPENSALLVQRFHDVASALPARYPMRFNGSDGHDLVFAEGELFNDGAIKTDKKPVIGLGDLQ